MASFQAKIGRKRMRNREIKIIVPIRSYPKRNRKFHKISKKKCKNTIMVSFQAKIGWSTMRKSENKNSSSVPFLSDT